MGHGALRQEALRESLPDFYASAVREHEVDVIAAPEIDITEGEEEGDLHFDAVVEVPPHVTIPGYAGLQVTIERPEATDEDIDRQVDRLRGNDATLEDVSRPAKDGDVLTIDLGMTADRSERADATSPTSPTPSAARSSASPSSTCSSQGARVGDIIKFTAEASPRAGRWPSRSWSRRCGSKRLPDLTDEWVGGGDRVRDRRGARRTTCATRITDVQAGAGRRSSCARRRSKRWSSSSPTTHPRPLVEAEVERRLHDLGPPPRGAGGDARAVPAGHRAGAARRSSRSCGPTAVPSVKADLALRALADAEEIEATEEDVDNEIARMAEQAGQLRRPRSGATSSLPISCPRYARTSERPRRWPG